jgi:hypothetical protein
MSGGLFQKSGGGTSVLEPPPAPVAKEDLPATNASADEVAFPALAEDPSNLEDFRKRLIAGGQFPMGEASNVDVDNGGGTGLLEPPIPITSPPVFRKEEEPLKAPDFPPLAPIPTAEKKPPKPKNWTAATIKFNDDSLHLKSKGGLAACRGDLGFDSKCDRQETTGRVCAQLLDGEGEPKIWGDAGNFWDLTQKGGFANFYKNKMLKKQGDSMCISEGLTAKLIEKAGCKNVQIRCDATDVNYVMGRYTDMGMDLSPVKACLEEQCQLSQQVSHVVVGFPAATLLGALVGAGAAFATFRACRQTVTSSAGGQPLLSP